MTKAIPVGTCNVPLNILEVQRAIVGRLAFRANKSTGRFIWETFIRGLKAIDAEAATILATLSNERERRRWLASAATFVLGLWCVAQEFDPMHKVEMRRGRATSLSRTLRRMEVGLC